MEQDKFTMSDMTKASVWSLSYFSLFLCTVISAILVLFYLYIIKPYVLLPADILMWGETDFVGNIIKIRNGLPIYTAPENSNSGIYTPGAPLLTYLISWILGKTTSIAVLRMIQLGYVTCAAIVATSCLKMLHKISFPDHSIPFPKTWTTLSFLVFFLTATSPRVNAFSHCLHLDALAILISMFCFWTMLRYLKSPVWGNLILMAVCPALGYLVKQFLISWSAVMFIFLLLLHPRDIKRLAIFALMAAVCITAAMGSCYLLWADDFIFWTFKVMGGSRAKMTIMPTVNHVSLVRILDHVVRAWMELLIGFVGGCLVLRKNNIQRLGPLWVAWILLIASEAYSGGAGWSVLYHFGPGVLIGVIWLFVALVRFWPYSKESPEWSFLVYSGWIRPVVAVIWIITLLVALHVVPTADRNEGRYYKRRPPADTYRYISDIEKEFEGLPIQKVLLDIGNWVYLKQSYLAKDRAVSLADQPLVGIYDNLNVFVDRIRTKAYEKILVRDFYSPYFLYDYVHWERPSGVKKALVEYYKEVRTIPGIEGDTSHRPGIMHSGPISVFVPQKDGGEDMEI
jgi:hypothetical protein